MAIVGKVEKPLLLLIPPPVALPPSSTHDEPSQRRT
jgi:hypothetical protein